MIPYVEVPAVEVGSLSLQPFGMLVALGCAVGYHVARWQVGRAGLDRGHVPWIAASMLVAGFLGSYWVAILFEDPRRFLTEPFSFWKMMSSYGGFLGGVLGGVVYLKRYRLPVLAYCDCFALGLLSGWFFGRLGCSLVHDHVGVPSDFPLAVRFPDGPRHDLGLYEWLFTIVLLLVAFLVRSRRPPAGTVLGLLAVSYAPVRFVLDTLRVGETRVLGLTSGQWFSVVAVVLGASLLLRLRSGTGAEVST